MADFPRVLLVTPSVFNPYTGGGITLSNLFRGWPRDRIAAAHSDPHRPSTNVCERYYRLGSAELGWMWPLSLLQRRQGGAEEGGAGGEGEVASSPPQASSRSRSLARDLARGLKSAVAAEGLSDRATLTPELREWVREFRPDVIYTILGNLGYLRLVRQIVQATGAPSVIHMMDDWPAVSYRKGLLAPWYRHQMEVELQDAVDRASVCLGICPSMCDAYEERYGSPFRSFSNALDMEQWIEEADAVEPPDRPASQIVYSGSIVDNAQRDALHHVCTAVEALAAGGMRVELLIRTPAVNDAAIRAEFGGYPNLRFGPPPLDDEIVPLLSGADVLLLPVNFDPESVAYIRYSNPTKLPAYLAVGTPILVYGPRGVDQVERALRDGWGLVVDQPGAVGVRDALRRLLTDQALRSRLRTRSREVAERDHDAAVVRPAFRDAFREAAGGSAAESDPKTEI